VTGRYKPREITIKQSICNRRREWLERAHRRNPRCHYCGNTTELKPRDYNMRMDHTTEIVATLDHAIPRAHGGTEWEGNYRLACAVCNTLKGTMSEREYIEMLEEEGLRA